jgi:protein involved in polysaccharide export with SLBB domain
VRPDGFVSLPLVHELHVADRTVEELRQELFQRYSAELADPELAVIVRTVHSYPVHVGGEVGEPGVLALQGEHGVVEAVMASGGFLATADLAEVRVARRLDDGGYKLIKADVLAFLEGRRGDGNVALRPHDVVFVPRSGISEVNKWVDQYIRRNIPIDFTYRLDFADTN